MNMRRLRDTNEPGENGLVVSPEVHETGVWIQCELTWPASQGQSPFYRSICSLESTSRIVYRL